MEKILLLVDAQNFKPAILDFVVSATKERKAKIVGVFLADNSQPLIPELRSIGGQVYVDEITVSEEELVVRGKEIDKSITLFKEECTKRSLNAGVHNDAGSPLEYVLKESRYADLIIADPTISLSNDKSVPSVFIKKLLAEAECPVLIAPEFFKQTDRVVFAYDGSKSSMFAIKQFYNHLPQFTDKEVVILHIAEESESDGKDTVGMKLFEEWLKMKVSKYTFVTIAGEPGEGLFTYFMQHNNDNKTLLVIGAFGRNFLSSFFKPSAADLVLKAIDIPIFVAHF